MPSNPTSHEYFSGASASVSRKGKANRARTPREEIKIFFILENSVLLDTLRPKTVVDEICLVKVFHTVKRSFRRWEFRLSPGSQGCLAKSAILPKSDHYTVSLE